MAAMPASSPPPRKDAGKEDSFRSTDSASDETRLTVALRVRPLLGHETASGNTNIMRTLGEKIAVLLDPHQDDGDILRKNRSREKRYAFDHVFGEDVLQEDIYRATTKTLLESVLDGYNATVFAYGPTGAGKTFTMLGTDSRPGIMYFTLKDLFRLMDDRRSEHNFEVTFSYVELYNEELYDLLVPQSGELDLREDANGHTVIAGVKRVPISTPDQIMKLLLEGNKRRTQEATAANSTSSRSHAILEVCVTQSSVVKDVHQEYKVGKLFMCDLAGSERAAHTKNTGQRMVEGQHINRSLLALGNCINSLGDIHRTNKYVNFRDSKLTRLLKDSLGGNCRTVMIAHVSPASQHFEESYNTLNYANRAKNIKASVRQNVESVDVHVTEYLNIIQALKRQIAKLKRKERKSSRAASISSAGAGHSPIAVVAGADACVEPDPHSKHNPPDTICATHQLIQRLQAAQQKQLRILKPLFELQERIHEMAQRREMLQDVREGAAASSATLEKPRREMSGTAIAAMLTEEERMLADREDLISQCKGQAAVYDDILDSLDSRAHNAHGLKWIDSEVANHRAEIQALESEHRSRILLQKMKLRDEAIQLLMAERKMRQDIMKEQHSLLTAHGSDAPESLDRLYAMLRDATLFQKHVQPVRGSETLESNTGSQPRSSSDAGTELSPLQIAHSIFKRRGQRRGSRHHVKDEVNGLPDSTPVAGDIRKPNRLPKHRPMNTKPEPGPGPSTDEPSRPRSSDERIPPILLAAKGAKGLSLSDTYTLSKSHSGAPVDQTETEGGVGGARNERALRASDKKEEGEERKAGEEEEEEEEEEETEEGDVFASDAGNGGLELQAALSPVREGLSSSGSSREASPEPRQDGLRSHRTLSSSMRKEHTKAQLKAARLPVIGASRPKQKKLPGTGHANIPFGLEIKASPYAVLPRKHRGFRS